MSTRPAKAKFTPITVNQAEKLKDESRLYVLNRAEGNVNFNVTSSAGERQVLAVPMTFCPIDLSNFAERASILRDPDFRRLVAKKAIVIIDADEGEKFTTEDSRGIAETARIYDVITGDSGDHFLYNDGKATDKELAERLGVEYENAFINNMVLRSGGDEEAADLISEIEAKQHLLTIRDIEYVANHAKSAELKSWAADQVEEMKLDAETRPNGQVSA